MCTIKKNKQEYNTEMTIHYSSLLQIHLQNKFSLKKKKGGGAKWNNYHYVSARVFFH